MTGLITAVGIAFRKLMQKLYESNHLGDSRGEYKDYTDKPMRLER